MENVGWTITFIVRIYYINTCCSLVMKFSNSIKDSLRVELFHYFQLFLDFESLNIFIEILGIVRIYYINSYCPLVVEFSNSIIANKWFWHFGNICTFSYSFSRIFFFLFRVCRFVYGILIFSRKIHNGAKSFMMLYQNFFYVSSI